jgi:hypothetical protein
MQNIIVIQKFKQGLQLINFVKKFGCLIRIYSKYLIFEFILRYSCQSGIQNRLPNLKN